MSVEIRNLAALLGKLQRIPDRLVGAVVRAVNDTAVEVQKFTVNTLLPSKFTLRARGAPWWKPGTKMGFNIRFAKPGSLSAVLGSQADWLKLQEEGGTKSAAGHRVAVVNEARPSKTAVLPAKLKPRRLLERSGGFRVSSTGKHARVRKDGAGFLIPLKSGSTGLFTNLGNGVRKLMYVLRSSTRIKPILTFVKSAESQVGAIYNRLFSKRITETLIQNK